MLYRYVEKGTTYIKVGKKKLVLVGYKNPQDALERTSVNGSLLGYIKLKNLGKEGRDALESVDQVEILGSLYDIESENPKGGRCTNGCILVQNSSGSYDFIEIYSTGLLPILASKIPMFAWILALLALIAIIFSLILVPKFINENKKDIPPIVKEKDTDKDKPEQDRGGIVIYNGDKVGNGGDSVKKEEGSYTNFLYYDIMLKVGEALPLVDEPSNGGEVNTQFNYVITDNGKVILDKWVRPGEAFPWIPTLGVGSHSVTFDVNAWSLDSTQQWMGQHYDVKLTINN